MFAAGLLDVHPEPKGQKRGPRGGGGRRQGDLHKLGLLSHHPPLSPPCPLCSPNWLPSPLLTPLTSPPLCFPSPRPSASPFAFLAPTSLPRPPSLHHHSHRHHRHQGRLHVEP